jgi:thiosulfate/3-mercaptopyruvate sulfurtransferase
MHHTTLIDAATLSRHIDKFITPNANTSSRDDDNLWLIVDCRFDLADPMLGLQQFQQARIPGARYAHLDHDLSEQAGNGVNGGRHPLPTREHVRARFEAIGVTDNTQVVAYDASGGMVAARLWWMLRWIGHEAVAVLDGGWQAWVAGGYSQEDREPSAPATGGSLTLRPALSQWIGVDAVLANLEGGSRVLIDARAADRFDGSNETIDAVGGHIPGALNRFFRNNLETDGRFKSAITLREAFLSLSAGRPVIHQCGSGVSACHNLLAMQHAGLPAGALYGGSWSEWVSDLQRPVTR